MKKIMFAIVLMFIVCLNANAVTTTTICPMTSSHNAILYQNGNYVTIRCTFAWCGSWNETYYNQGCSQCYTNNLVRRYSDYRLASGLRLVTISSQCVACMYYIHPVSYFYGG